MKPTMAEDMTYVFGFMFAVEHGTHELEVTKTRWAELDGGTIQPDIAADVQPAEQMARDMRDWLASGVETAGAAPGAATPVEAAEPPFEVAEPVAPADPPTDPAPAPAPAPSPAPAAAAPPAPVEDADIPALTAACKAVVHALPAESVAQLKEQCTTLGISWSAGTAFFLVQRLGAAAGERASLLDGMDTLVRMAQQAEQGALV
jgi:hypothetical protein